MRTGTIRTQPSALLPARSTSVSPRKPDTLHNATHVIGVGLNARTIKNASAAVLVASRGRLLLCGGGWCVCRDFVWV